MTLFLVRHASAGVPLTDPIADRSRELDDRGQAQARAITQRLLDAGAKSVHSSPYMRCTQTVGPLAEQLRTEITTYEEFGEGREFTPALALCEQLDPGSVVCSHGDLIPALIEAMQRRHMTITGPTGFRKASIWVIERSSDGQWLSATWWDRPKVTPL